MSCLILSFTVAEAKSKWKNLRDQYVKVRRALKEKKSGSAAGSKKLWPYYHIMTWLEPFLNERATSGNMPQLPTVTQVCR